MNYHSTSVLFEGCTSTYPLAYGSTVVPGRVSPDALSTTTVTGPLLMWAQPLYVEYQETDLSLFSTTISTSLSTSLTAQPSSTNSAPSGNITAVSPLPTIIHNSALSSGAKAGIGVAAVAGALVLLALVFFCMRWRRTSRLPAKRPMQAPSSSWERKELDASDARRELDGSPLENELDASESRRELDGSPFESPKQIIARKPVAQAIVELE